MATLSKLKPGQILYDVYKACARSGEKWEVYPVEVIFVQNDHAICSWNHNIPTRYDEKAIKRLRVTDPNSKKTNHERHNN